MSERPKSAGISIEDCSNIKISNNIVAGFDVGLLARNVSDLTVEDFAYKGAGQAFDITGQSASITGTRIKPEAKSAETGHPSYIKPNGPPLPAQCPRCKSIFPSRHFNVALQRFMAKDNKEPCPVCGSPDATLAEGLFDLVGEFVKVIEADGDAVALLRAIGAVVAATPQSIDPANSDEINKAIDKIAEVSPAAADVLRKGLARRMFGVLLLLFTTLAALSEAYDFNEKYKALDTLSIIYSEMSEMIVKKVGDHDYQVKRVDAEEHPRVGNSSKGILRKHSEQLNSSTALPKNIPIPIPRPAK